MPSTLPTLPALRCLGDLADVRPTILVDTREQNALEFTRLNSERATLQTGDYSFRGGHELFAVERKTVADLVGCCVGDNRDRFCRELHRLRGYRFKRLLIVGSPDEIRDGKYRGETNPRTIFSTLDVIEVRYDTAVVFEPTPEAAALRVESWAFWFAREMVSSVNDLARAHGLTQRTPVTA